MENIVIVVHILVALAIVGLILLQQGKGAEAGASFGAGASQTVFGSQGGGNFFAKVTAVLAVIFFATSFSLTIIAKNKAIISTEASGLPAVVESAPQESEVPVVSSEVNDVSSDIPLATPAPNDNQESVNQDNVSTVNREATDQSDVPTVNQQ